MDQRRNKSFQKGQVALIVLLIMAAALTLGLATSKKVVVDTKLDKDEELLKQAFNAAESGVETYLGSGSKQYLSSDRGSQAQVQTQNIGAGTTLLSGGAVPANTAAIFWMVPHNNDAQHTVNWGGAYSGSSVVLCVSTTFDRSIKINYFYRTAGNVINVDRFVYNLSNSGSRVQNGLFSSPGAAGGACVDTNYRSAVTLNLHGTPGLITATPLFGNTPLMLTNQSGIAFPIQGEMINSVGSAGDVNQNVGAQRVVQVQHTYAATSTLLQYILEGLESAGGITNQ